MSDAPDPHGDPLDAAASWLEQGHQTALATVIQTWGSSPRPAGSQLAVRDDGLFVGSVSGGCVEGEVVHQAIEVMGSGQPRRIEFGVSNEQAWEVGLACGGRIALWLEAVQ